MVKTNRPDDILTGHTLNEDALDSINMDDMFSDDDALFGGGFVFDDIPVGGITTNDPFLEGIDPITSPPKGNDAIDGVGTDMGAGTSADVDASAGANTRGNNTEIPLMQNEVVQPQSQGRRHGRNLPTMNQPSPLSRGHKSRVDPLNIFEENNKRSSTSTRPTSSGRPSSSRKNSHESGSTKKKTGRRGSASSKRKRSSNEGEYMGGSNNGVASVTATVRGSGNLTKKKRRKKSKSSSNDPSSQNTTTKDAFMPLDMDNLDHGDRKSVV